jgi:hypothetical protein
LFYVYELLTPKACTALGGSWAQWEPIYVGKGKDKRVWKNHSKDRRRVAEWMDATGLEPNFVFVAADLTEFLAFKMECDRIAARGRLTLDPGGSLLNIALGGQGSSGVRRRAETIEKHRKSVMATWNKKRAEWMATAPRGLPCVP